MVSGPLGKPLGIAHRVNSVHRLHEALLAHLGMIEIDVHRVGRDLAVRHDFRVRRLPLVYGRWRLGVEFRPFRLSVLMDHIPGSIHIMLDVKTRGPHSAKAVVEAIHRYGIRARTEVSSMEWDVLDAIGQVDRALPLLYSVGSPHQLEDFLRRLDGPFPPAGLSVRQSLLNADLLRQLIASGVKTYAWTVRDHDRAIELASWRVDGLIADDYAMLANLTI